jgi:hypothetical protein
MKAGTPWGASRLNCLKSALIKVMASEQHPESSMAGLLSSEAVKIFEGNDAANWS